MRRKSKKPAEKPPLNLSNLKAGDEISFSGVIYTARDQAHKRLVEALARGKTPPFDVKGKIIYYCGPTRALKGKVIGSCGPTTSSRMDAFAPALLKAGLFGMIGKGRRSAEVRQAIKKYKGVYFLTHAGCGALLSQFVVSKALVAYPDLGPEAVYRLTVNNFPLITAIDAEGKSIFR